MKILIVLFFPVFVYAEMISGVVTKVVDGDTLHMNSDGVTHKVRLYGIDAPEKKQPYGKWSGKKLESYVLNKKVEAEIINIDRYKRNVAIIYKNGKDINQMMINAGYAWYYPKYCKIKEICTNYLDAENEARKARRGLWRSLPYEPSEWRQK